MLVPKLRFNEFTDEWKSYKLSDVVDFLDGQRKPIKDTDRNSIKGIYPYYGASGIIDYINDYIFDEELLLLGEDGANIITRSTKLVFKATEKYWVNNHAHVLKPKNRFNINFLEAYLENLNYEQYNTGTAQPKLNQEVCRKIIINTPNEKEQEKIGETLSLIDQKIELQNKKIEVLKLYSESTKKILFSDSKSWEYKKIKEIIKYERPDKYIVKRTEYSNKFDIPVLTANKGFILGYTNEKDNIYKNNSIIFDDFTMDMKYVNFPFKIKSSAIKILTSNNNLLFLYESIKNLKLVSSEHKRHYIEYVQEFDIPIPSLEKQEKIAKIINCFNQKILNENKKIEQLNNLKIGLMQSMFV